MANINNGLSDHVEFYLSSPNLPTLKVETVIGWNELGLEASRNKDYHGTLVSVSKELGFIGQAKRYIEQAFELNDCLTELQLTKKHLKVVDNEVKYVSLKPLQADFYTKKIKNNILTINFYSNELQHLIDAHEDTEFELERLKDIEENEISILPYQTINLKGRSMISNGQSNVKDILDWKSFGNDRNYLLVQTLETEVVSEGPFRHSSATEAITVPFRDNYITSSNMFYDNRANEEEVKRVKISFSAEEIELLTDAPDCALSIIKYKEDENQQSFSVEYIQEIYRAEPIPGYYGTNYWRVNNLPVPDPIRNFTKELEFDVAWNEGLALVIKRTGKRIHNFKIKGAVIKIAEIEFYEKSKSRFLFYYDVMERLMEILTGTKNSFTSNFLGRKEKGYKKDGEGGLIGFVSGLWVRGFSNDSVNYKSPKVSLKKSIQSICNCFNLGAGTETIKGIDKLVIEDIKYFYRDEIIGSFDQNINSEEESIFSEGYYSGLEIGYQKSGGVEQEMGLDEPNNKSEFITPVKNTSNKFEKLIEVRADEYKMEELRRQNFNKFPDKQIDGDEDNWFLDLKRNLNQFLGFEQKHWSDRLSEIPKGIHDPDSFRTFWFTPFTILRRFSNLFSTGLFKFKDKSISYTSGSPNTTLSMKYKDEDEEYAENGEIKINKLKSPLFKNRIIKFTHPYNDNVEWLIHGKTEVVVNGEKRMVPNFYFKHQFTTNEGKVLLGYFLSYQYDDNPTFEYQLINNEII